MAKMLNVENSGRPAPRWFRKFKKIWTNTETAAIVILLACGFKSESFLILCVKTSTNWLLENLETLLANGEDYAPAKQVNE
jgi:hypothetical protein